MSEAPTLSEIGIVGRINGMGEPDPEGSYLCIAVCPKGGDPQRLKVSVGAAEVLRAEIDGALEGGKGAYHE